MKTTKNATAKEKTIIGLDLGDRKHEACVMSRSGLPPTPRRTVPVRSTLFDPKTPFWGLRPSWEAGRLFLRDWDPIDHSETIAIDHTAMTAMPLQTERLRLIAPTLDEVRAQIDAMDADQKATLGQAWLARLEAATDADAIWTLGFTLMHRTTQAIVGQCAFKGPPSPDKSVEIAYMVAPEHQGNGYATEAASRLVAFAFGTGQVRVVRAHTLREQNASTRVLAKCGFSQIGDVFDPEDGLVWRWEKHDDAAQQ